MPDRKNNILGFFSFKAQGENKDEKISRSLAEEIKNGKRSAACN